MSGTIAYLGFKRRRSWLFWLSLTLVGLFIIASAHEFIPYLCRQSESGSPQFPSKACPFCSIKHALGAVILLLPIALGVAALSAVPVPELITPTLCLPARQGFCRAPPLFA